MKNSIRTANFEDTWTQIQKLKKKKKKKKKFKILKTFNFVTLKLIWFQYSTFCFF